MTIKQYGGVFGRNPTFRNVEVEGDLSIDGTLTIGGSVITGLNLQGNWNASTNTPDLTVLTPDAGKFWIVSVAGSTNLGGFTNWTVGDWALYDGSAWQRIEGGTVDLSNAVTGTLAITNGGTGASTASTARTNLGSGAVGDNLFTATTSLAAQQAMDTEVGTDVQAYDAGLQSISGLTTAADKMIYTTASDTYAVTDLTAAGRAILDDADAAAQRTTLGSGAVGDNVFTAATASAAQQAMDVEVGVDVQAYDATILKSADIGVTVEAYDSTILKSADIGVTVEAYDSTILKSADIGVTVQGYDSTILNAADIGVTVEAYDATILKSADIGSTVQGYDADTAKYDDATANFTGTLQNNGSNVVVDSDIGSTVQAYDADTAKLDVAQTWTAKQTFGDTDIDGAAVFNESGADVDFRIESDTDANAFFLDGTNGNVGINTNTPAKSLHVYNGASGCTPFGAGILIEHNTNTYLEFNTPTGLVPGITWATPTQQTSGTILYHTTSRYMRFGTAGTEKMRIDSDGNMLVGYTSSNGAYKLQVNSQIFATSATIATSDGNYKENVKPLDGALSLISQLNPVQFDWKEHPVHEFDRNQPTIGFIAQEVQQVLADQPYLNSIVKANECVLEPEEADEDGNVIKEAVTEPFLGIAEGNMVALLTKALQEAVAKIESLETRIAALESN